MGPGKKSIVIWIVLAAAAAALLFWSRGKGGKEEVPVLKVSFSLAEPEWKVFREKILPPFEQANHCRVEAAQVDAADLPKLLQAGKLSGKQTIDVFGQDNMQLALLVKQGLVEDLSELRSTLPREVTPALLEAGKFGDKLFFIPFRPNVQIFYYNEAKFREYGIEPPRSWDDWLAAAKLFKEKEGIGRVLIKGFGGAVTVTQMYEFIESAGGDAFAFNDEGSKRTFAFFQELWRYASPDCTKAKWDTSNDYLAQDSVYLMQNWPFGYKIITQDYGKKDVGVYHGFPGPAREAHVIGGDVFGIPTGAGNRELALRFIQHMLSKEVQSLFVSELSWPAVREDVYGASDSPAFKAVKDALAFGIYRKNVPYWAEYQKLFEEAFLRVVVGGEPIEKLDEFHNRMQEIIANAG